MALTEKLVNIADAIREKTGKTDGLTLEQMPGEIAGIQVGDGSGENPLDYAGNLQYAFQKTNFGGVDFAVSFGAKAGTIQGNAMESAFRDASVLNSLKITCGFGTATEVSFANFLRGNTGDTTLKTLDLSGSVHVLKPTNMSRFLDYRTGLVEILGEIDMSSCTNTSVAFQSVSNLETIRLKEGTLKVSTSLNVSSKLTDETIQNIIDSLADLTGGAAQTLTLHATVGAKLTDAQKSSASAKNWTISY